MAHIIHLLGHHFNRNRSLIKSSIIFIHSYTWVLCVICLLIRRSFQKSGSELNRPRVSVKLNIMNKFLKRPITSIALPHSPKLELVLNTVNLHSEYLFKFVNFVSVAQKNECSRMGLIISDDNLLSPNNFYRSWFSSTSSSSRISSSR